MALREKALSGSSLMKFEQYKAQFPYKGKAIYTTVFERHSDSIKTKKLKFAVNNLEKIFKVTFRISSKTGFHAMSLRDLCRETGLSMGGIYSCIGSKDDIAIFVKDMVQLVSAEILDAASKQEDPNQVLEEIIRHHIYAADILHPWFYFLYFETRSLPREHQQDSKAIELKIVKKIEALLKKMDTDRKGNDHHIIATMALVMIQERYLKHWKYKGKTISLDDHASKILQLVHAALSC